MFILGILFLLISFGAAWGMEVESLPEAGRAVEKRQLRAVMVESEEGQRCYGISAIKTPRHFTLDSNHIKTRENKCILKQDGDGWTILDPLAGKKWKKKSDYAPGVYFLEGSSLVQIIENYGYALYDLETDQQKVNRIMLPIRAIEGGLVVSCVHNGTFFVYELLSGTLVAQRTMSDSLVQVPNVVFRGFDVVLTSSGKVVFREFIIKEVAGDKGTSSMLRENNNCFEIWDPRVVIAPVKILPTGFFKLAVIDDAIISFELRKTSGHFHLHVSVWNDKGILVNNFPLKQRVYVVSPHGESDHSFYLNRITVKRRAIAADANYISLCFDNTVFIAERSKYGQVHNKSHRGAYICFQNKGKTFSGAKDGSVCVWDSKTGELLATHTFITPLKHFLKADFFCANESGDRLYIGRKKALSKLYSLSIFEI